MPLLLSLSLVTSLLLQAGQQAPPAAAPAPGAAAAASNSPGTLAGNAGRGKSVVVGKEAAGATPDSIAPPLSEDCVTMTYNHPQTQPTRYVLIIHEDGRGHFHSDPLKTLPPGSEGPPATAVDADVSISPELREKLFEVARGQKVKSGNCEDGGSKIAFQGTKRLIYESPAGRQECEFNWSRDKQIQMVTEQLQAVAQTLEAGRRLEAEHLHDRLGLDAELESLLKLVAEGHAAEIGNIAPQLRDLVNDPAVLDRVRRRARTLLEPSK